MTLDSTDSQHWEDNEHDIFIALCTNKEYIETTLQQIKKQMMIMHL